MNISKKAWHYRLNQLWASSIHDIPWSLCPYFWYTILSIFKTIGAAIAALVISTILFKFLSWWVPSLSIIWSTSYADSLGAWAIASFLLYGFTHLIVDMWEDEHYMWVGGRLTLTAPRPWWMTQIKLIPKSKPAVYNPSSFGAVTANYLGALHDKVCPTLKFVDE